MGVKRGQCKEEDCKNCPRYQAADDAGEGGGPCLNCGHFPALHENLGLVESEESNGILSILLFILFLFFFCTFRYSFF